MKQSEAKKMTFGLRILPDTIELLRLLLLIENDDPYTSHKYPMSLGDYCLLSIFF